MYTYNKRSQMLLWGYISTILFMVIYNYHKKEEGFLMNTTNTKWNITKIKTSYFVFFGAIVGAIVGLAAYVNNWL